MSAVIFDTRNGRILKIFDTFRGAKGAFTRMTRKENCDHLECATAERYEKTGAITANETVEVFSIFDTNRERPIKIRRMDVGTACDPSMELYHTM